MSFVKTETEKNQSNRAVVVSVIKSKSESNEANISLDELVRLCDTLGLVVKEKFTQTKKDISSSTYVGKGFLESVMAKMEMIDAEYLIFDNELSPSQSKSISKINQNIKVIDRTEVILQIFKKHASSKEARLQVRLAELKYEMPRLKNLWSHFQGENVAAGKGAGGGGGASRGMGEKQIEVDQRLMKRELFKIETELKKIEQHRVTQGKSRGFINKICLVGYTNAGKSTLFNRLTDAGVYVKDQLFATLESTARKFNTGVGEDQVLIDTVGFISKLPHNLVASFKATLRDVNTADLLLHTMDANDPQLLRNLNSVEKVLDQIDAKNVKQIMVLNKADNLSEEKREEILAILTKYDCPKMFISALTGENIKNLIDLIEQNLNRNIICSFKLPYSKEAIKAKLYDIGKISNIEYEDEYSILTGEFHTEEIAEYEEYLIDENFAKKRLTVC